MIRNCILDNTYGVHVVIKFIIVQHNYDQNLLKLLKIITVIIAMIASVGGVDSELLHLSVLLKTYNGAYWEKVPIGNLSHHVGFILELCSKYEIII